VPGTGDCVPGVGGVVVVDELGVDGDGEQDGEEDGDDEDEDSCALILAISC
jgi:hypothetical protein